MKRPLAVTGLTGLCTQCLLLMVKPFFSLLFSIGTGAAALGCLCIPAVRKRTVVWVVLLTMAVTGSTTTYWQYYGAPIRELDGKTAAVYGQVVELEVHENYTMLTVEAHRVINQRTEMPLAENIRIVLYTYDRVNVQNYDEVEIMLAELKAPEGGFGITVQGHYAAQGVYIIGQFPGDSLTARPGKAPWYHIFDDLRHAMITALYEILPEEHAALATAMALGDRSKLSEETKRDFRFSGLGPVLVVSGLHLSMIIGLLHRFLRTILTSNRIAVILSMPLMVVFVGMTGSGSSSIRAAVVMTISLLGILLTCSPEPMNALGGAALVLLCIRPCVAGDAGVQLSFAAIAGILIFGRYLDHQMYIRLPARWLEHEWLRSTLSGLHASVGATIFTLPLTALMFGYVPMLAVVSNWIAAIPTAVVLVGAMLTGGFGALGWETLAHLCGWVTGQGVRVLTRITEIFARGPLLYDDGGLLLQLAAAVLLGIGLLWLIPMRRRSRNWGIAAVLLVTMLIGVGTEWFPDPKVRVRVADCGNGIAVQVRQGHDAVTLLADGARRDPWTTAQSISGKNAGTVILLNDTYDADAVRVVNQMVPRRIRQVTMRSPLMPDEWYGKTLPWPVETDGSGQWCVGEITVRCSGDAPYCVVEANRIRILIPLAGANLQNFPAEDTFADLAVLAYGRITHAQRIRARYLVFSANADTTQNLVNKTFGVGIAQYSTELSGTLEFIFDEYGRMEVLCP